MLTNKYFRMNSKEGGQNPHKQPAIFYREMNLTFNVKKAPQGMLVKTQQCILKI